MVNAVALIRDHGDGGGSTVIVPDLETLKNEYFLEDAKYYDEGEERDEFIKEQLERYESALSGNNPYEDGEIDQSAGFNVEVDEETGEVTLVGSIYASWGQ